MTSQPALIVGIGASAGGIPALEGLFRELTDAEGMAFVIVTHLSPERKSLLHEVIAHYTALPVLVARDGAAVEDRHVYVMPEGKILSLSEGRLRLRDDDPIHRERRPIDVFLASLGQDQGENAVGIVLSGGDSDGTLGVKAIKECGGITMAQTHDGSGPRNPQMPDSAMASGLIDIAVPVERMPAELLRIREGFAAFDIFDEAGREPGRDEQVRRAQTAISRLLRSQAGHDFSGYKHKTFMRRVARRMKVVQLRDLDAYLQRLRDDPDEVQALFRDLLINVTNFFRDAGAFRSLEEQVVPRLFEGRGADDAIRVWVPGCATGEEVYSIGVLMRERAEAQEAAPRVQIFATDIDGEALALARAGRYPEVLLADMDPERRRRFFRRDGSSWGICKEVRDMCSFSPHSVISDPPFSRMDLVSCRNLLIYLGAQLQNQVIPTFHYALKPGGYLFLGTSEGVSRHGDLFSAVDKRNRIFQARDHVGAPPRLPMTLDQSGIRRRMRGPGSGHLEANGPRLRQRIEAQVLERHAPAHVVVTRDEEILYFSSGTGAYLEMPRGAPNRQLLDLARRDLRIDLRTALREAIESGRTVERQVLMRDKATGKDAMIALTVEPLAGPGDGEPLYLALFAPVAGVLPARPDDTAQAAVHDIAMEKEQELREMRERLQSTIEEYETALEELKSSNEELVSVNEEAQSSNEELEASKEEMQSLNEELSTINAELARNVDDLDRANTDLRNLYAATRIATVFLDGDLVIRNYTPAAASVFNLRDSDIGRPLSDLAGVLRYPDLREQVRQVFETGEGIETRQSGFEDDAHHLIRLSPYRDSDDGVSGVVVTIVDITSLARAEAQQKTLISELNHRVKNMLSIIISVANSTRKNAGSAEEYSQKFIGRLHGMARAYSLLSRSEWTSVSVRDLVQAEMEAFGADRFDVEGPEVALAPQQALALGMVVHEMATNAAKYGALAKDTGRVRVCWKTGGGRLSLRWTESGGPPVQAPEGKGFGLVLIEGQVTIQLDGAVEVRFPPDGLVLDLSIPMEAEVMSA